MKARTVILAAGEFPRRGGVAWNLLANSRLVVACDSAADAYRRRFGKSADYIVGDMDSVRSVGSAEVVRDTDQNTNDLTKAIEFCRSRGWRDIVIVGATGKREDHSIGNVFRALDAMVPVVTDYGVFHPFVGKAMFGTAAGAAVSVFAPYPGTKMTSRGLVWPLDEVAFENLYVATLNRASAKRITLTTTRPACVFLASAAQ